MKEKNKKMIIILISLLLVVGVSLAYFTASTIFGGNGTTVTGSTTAPQGSELIVEGTLEFNDLDIYPGHQNVSSIKVTATGDNELIPYNIIFNGINTLNTPLNYTVYKTSSSIDVNASCEKKSEVMGGAKIYYEECSISNIESLGSPVSSGTIESSEENSKTTLVKDEFITSSPTTEEVYYYVVLEYPNLEESQNIDMGGTFSGEVTIEISDVEPDINIIAAYIEQEDGSYEQVSDIPQSGYTLDTEKSTCSNGAIPTGNTPNITINNLSKSGTSCYLYFKTISAKEFVLAHYSMVLTRGSFSSIVTDRTVGTIYKSLNSAQYDNNGEVYYFAGNPQDNWISFGGFYWRIIRINGNGSIRIIYSGDASSGPVSMGQDTQISLNGDNTFQFNNAIDRSEYVGLKYTLGQQYGQNVNSTLLNTLQLWYTSSGLSAEQYSKYIDTNIGFCSDRSTSNGSWSSTAGSIQYSAYTRSQSKELSLQCDDNDILKIPVGLITADEVGFAGEVYGNFSTSHYLTTNLPYWTMSPMNYTSSLGAIVFFVNGSGFFNGTSYTVDTKWGVRPVINLSSDVKLTGSGTVSDPYRVV